MIRCTVDLDSAPTLGIPSVPAPNQAAVLSSGGGGASVKVNPPEKETPPFNVIPPGIV
jgi:hypothetical protein